MTQEDKELLLKDLCARLPYGVKVLVDNKHWCDFNGRTPSEITFDNSYRLLFLGTELGYVKPYLFPLSSMSEEQKQEYTYIMNYISPDDTDNWKEGEFIYVEQFTQLMHFYHINHLDYRGLIPMGLANDATGLNIY